MFSDKLQKLRKAKGFSQESLAEKLGVSRQTVAKWESGESLPDLGIAASIAALFGVSLDSMTDYGPGSASPPGKYAFGAVRLGERGQFVLPKNCRDIFGLNPGDYLIVLGDIERGIALIKVTPDIFHVFDPEEDDG